MIIVKLLPKITLPLLMLASGAAAQPAATPPQQMPAARAGFERMLEQAEARAAAAESGSDVRGTGPWPARLETDLALPNFTIYRPADLTGLATRKLGLVIWGNGGCSDDGASAYKELAQIASHGYLVIAPGRPLTSPLALPGTPTPALMKTTLRDLREALDWALAENGRPGSPYYRRIDPRMIAAAGHSCGGMQAILLADDPRIATLIVHNSGIVPILPDNPPLVMHAERNSGIRRPTLFLLGGESDVVWKYGMANFEAVTRAPVMLASLDTGHGGTFSQANGGEVASVAVDWLEWQLRASATAASRFRGPDCGLCRDPKWTIRKKRIP